MKVIIDNKIPFIQGRLEREGVEVVYSDPAAITPETVKDADALIVRTRTRCDRNLLEKSSVGLVVTATIGTDHIDLVWCAENGVEVRNAAGCNAPGVAQYVWSSLLRNGFNPGHHTLGVVGCGHVGSIVADWGKRMGAKVIVCDPPRKDSGLTDHDYISLRELLRESDAVTIHTPLTAVGGYPTYHLIGEKELEMLRPGAIFINSSRGPVVDNNALSAHLKAGGNCKAIIDVWEGEPKIYEELLSAVEIGTPHIAGYSRQGKERATRMALEAVSDFFNLPVSTEGLCPDYMKPDGKFPDDAGSIISQSYDPYADDRNLRKAPGQFEKLRSDYDYRDEPSFCF